MQETQPDSWTLTYITLQGPCSGKLESVKYLIIKISITEQFLCLHEFHSCKFGAYSFEESNKNKTMKTDGIKKYVATGPLVTKLASPNCK